MSSLPQLKNDAFSHLREARQHPQSICPSLNESLAVIREMVDQVRRWDWVRTRTHGNMSNWREGAH